MDSTSVASFGWPAINNTVSVVALVLAVTVFVFGVFSGTRGNKIRMVFAVCLATAIGWFAMPMAVKAASALNILGTKTGVVVLVSAMMLFVAALATTIYEIVTVTLSDVGVATKK
jgi:hypothetical protein